MMLILKVAVKYGSRSFQGKYRMNRSLDGGMRDSTFLASVKTFLQS